MSELVGKRELTLQVKTDDEGESKGRGEDMNRAEVKRTLIIEE